MNVRETSHHPRPAPSPADSGSLRVLMIAPQFRPIVGGAERQAEKLAAELAALGHQVEIWTPWLAQESARAELANGVLICRFPLSDASRIRIPLIGALNVPWIALQLFVRLNAPIRRADVVHCHIGCLITTLSALIARAHGKPAICKAAIAGDGSDVGVIARSGIAGYIIAPLARSIFRFWIATTNAVQSSLQDAGVRSGRIRLIPNGVGIRSSQDRQQRNAVRRFLYLGRLSTNIARDLETVIRAFDVIADEFPTAELAIVGAGDLFDVTSSLVERSRNADRVRMPGFGDPDAWIAWADCLVHPSRREGLSNTILEAMAAGLPCIANDIPANREVLDHGSAGMLVPVGDVGALVSAMRRIATDATVASELAMRARSRAVGTYSLGAVAVRYVELYRSLADDNAWSAKPRSRMLPRTKRSPTPN